MAVPYDDPLSKWHDWSEGKEVYEIELDQPNGLLRIDHAQIKRMTVRPQYGQQAHVPWVLVEWEDGMRDYYNAALLRRVVFRV